MSAVLVRIFLRYLAGALVAKGMVSPDLGNYVFADPEIASWVEVGAGIALGGAVEGFYSLAKRFGWST